MSFVEKVTTAGSKDYVDPSQRIAVFDNDGTLWAEQPVYFQALFLLDRIKQLSPKHPEWAEQEPFATVLRGEPEKILSADEKSLVALAMATHGNLTDDEFKIVVRDWLKSARHPQTGLPFTEMVYQPMLELLAYLRAEHFKTFIVSGGGIDFIRVFAEETYGIPPEQVVGTRNKAKYEIRDGTPVIVKLPELDFIDDGPGKPAGIHLHIGRRPIFAAGNSDGDYQMLDWTTSSEGARFGMILHHNDEDREFAYDRNSSIGKLDKAWTDAETKYWTVVDIKSDWKTIFPTSSSK
ncbi:haloacid dehalogenase-like hydrolase [Luteolibacter pohnpeiensis]|uniref:Haloacid dehalogenase-like hydrolase n=1 Tax=Luteolibacter pohnpeiensis TaxID=454153 RepID=A0A934VSY6_9BACT|nr:HAD family hydrolase [Luteolibacter pohnpeiensis]MBK1880927.1 haloacid dehalogenase-like hydrolase [Luteolibacter pohnpeiensis]